jgi:hypothetical protein
MSSSSLSDTISLSVTSISQKSLNIGDILVTEIEYEYINFLIYKKLIDLGEEYMKNNNDLKIKKQWKTTIQCFYWMRIDELEKNPQYNKLGLCDGYHPISRWEYTNIIKKNSLSCLSYFMELLDIKKNNEFFRTITEKYTDIINNKHVEIKTIRKSDKYIYVNNDEIIYKQYRYELDDRIRFLINKTSIQKVLRMLLRYSGLGIDGSHCALPSELYKYFYDNYNVRGEGYSSPLNSKLIEYEDTKICTAFYDTDKIFGSVGRFSRKVLIENNDHNWTVNPPYIENIIEFSFREIVAAMEEIQNDDFLVIYLILKRDNDLYNEICNYKYVQSYFEPEIGKHYMNCNGKLVYMKNNTVNSMFFISKNTKYKNVDFDKIMKIWNDKNNNPKLNQSFFEYPKELSGCNDLSQHIKFDDDEKIIPMRTNLPKSIRQFMNEESKQYKKSAQYGGKKYDIYNKYMKYINMNVLSLQ